MTFSPNSMLQHDPDDLRSPKIFVVGNSRSGTTMLGRILGQHHSVHTFGEIHFFEGIFDPNSPESRNTISDAAAEKMLARLLTSSRAGFFEPAEPNHYRDEVWEIMDSVPHRSAISLYAAFLNYETLRAGKNIPCEQTPRYLFYVTEILDFFPNARIVNLVRDPRDIMLSQKNKWRRRQLGAKSIPLREAFRSWINYHPIIIAKLWVSSVRTATNLTVSDRVISVRYEDLIENPEQTIRSLCNFLVLDFGPEMLHIPRVGSSTTADEPSKFGIVKTRAGSWRDGNLSRTEVAIMEWIAAKEMEDNGYELSGIPSPSVWFLPSFGVLLLKLGAAILLNVNRVRNFKETLRRRLISRRTV